MASRLITPTYTFTPGSPGTINLSGISGFAVNTLVGIVNLTTNGVIYARGLPGFGYSSVSGTTLTLQASTVGMSSGDTLAIKYEDANPTKLPVIGVAGTASADVLSIQGVASMTPMKVDGSATTQPANVTQVNGVTPATGAGASNTGTLRVIQSSDSAISASASASAGGVASFSRIPSSAASTNLTNAKASAGRVLKIVGYNTGGTVIRIKFYNAASTGAVTVGTTAVFFSRALPPGAFSYDMSDIGWYFSTGITYALVANAADSDATAIAAGAITDLHVEWI